MPITGIRTMAMQRITPLKIMLTRRLATPIRQPGITRRATMRMSLLTKPRRIPVTTTTTSLMRRATASLRTTIATMPRMATVIEFAR